jgi:hypothetical protein
MLWGFVIAAVNVAPSPECLDLLRIIGLFCEGMWDVNESYYSPSEKLAISSRALSFSFSLFLFEWLTLLQIA